MTMRLTAIFATALLASSLFTATAEARGGGFGGGGHMGGFGGGAHFGGMDAGAHVGGLGARTNLGGLGGGMHEDAVGSGVHVGGARVAGMGGDHHFGPLRDLHHRFVTGGDPDCLDWDDSHPAASLPLSCD